MSTVLAAPFLTIFKNGLKRKSKIQQGFYNHFFPLTLRLMRLFQKITSRQSICTTMGGKSQSEFHRLLICSKRCGYLKSSGLWLRTQSRSHARDVSVSYLRCYSETVTVLVWCNEGEAEETLMVKSAN